MTIVKNILYSIKFSSTFDNCRVFVIIIAIISTLWSMWCYFTFENHSISHIIKFGPGYIVAILYVCRAVFECKLIFRKFIWIISLVVQGGWLITIGKDQLLSGFDSGILGILIFLWWLTATVGSIICFFKDND